MTFEQFHNGLRLLLNLEGSELEFLTPVQQDNFYSNPHMFFIRSDDTTARHLWDVMYPKPKGPATGELRGNVVYPREWAAKQTDFEYDTGRPFTSEPSFITGTLTDHPPRTMLIN
ncbi:hypothetical protein D9M70_588990 [compost metagenome]